MKWLRAFLYIIVVCLFLEVIKTIIVRQQYMSSYFAATIIICIQFLLFVGAIVYGCLSLLLVKWRYKRKQVLIGLLTMSFFILLEGSGAWMLNHPERIPSFLSWTVKYYYDYYNSPLIQYEDKASEYNPDLFYRLKPMARFRYFNKEFNNAYHINSKGMRDSEIASKAPQIICLGDSYTMGWGVEQSETYPKQLEQLSRLKTLNAGTSSYGTAREMIQLGQMDTSALQYLIIQYCYNDLQENLTYISNNYTLPVSKKVLFDSLVAKQKLLKKYFVGKYGLLMGQVFLKKQLNSLMPVFPLTQERDHPFGNEEQHAKAFVDILYNAAAINFRKTRVIVTVLDSYEHMDNRFLENVQRLASQFPYKDRFGNNLIVLDMKDHLQKNDFYTLDLHIKPSGHAKVAEKIREKLQ